ncbi:hypothetical protein [Cohnella sp. GCM10012308]|uniref:hypothetical protein n=1 Tax=Cohnella sp. GCM10012308 TaxID=3317329 RepID=UPI0036183DFC
MSYPLPQKTEYLESKSIVGKLNGNGNGIDFFSSILVHSSLSMSDLESYYGAATFKTAKKSGAFPVFVDVLPVTRDRIATEHVERTALKFKSLSDLEHYENYYFVLIYDGGYDAGFDMRGH